MEGFNDTEVDLIIDYLIEEINKSENNNQEQIRFRNLVMFVLGINLPLKSNDFLSLKYSELFDKRDKPKTYELRLGRYHQDEIISIPLKSNVKKLLSAYRKKYNLTYESNADDFLFLSRKHQTITPRGWWNILNSSAQEANIKKNVGAESIRKTYGLNIYKNSKNKIKALLFLGELWGHVREAEIIKYLGLVKGDINFDYFLGEKFTLGNVDLKKIKCLK